MTINDIKTIIGFIMMIASFILLVSRVRTNFSRLYVLYELIENLKSERITTNVSTNVLTNVSTNVSTNVPTIADINLQQSQLQNFQNEYDTTYAWPWFGLACVFFTSGLCIIYF